MSEQLVSIEGVHLPADNDAETIGALYARAKTSIAESVTFQIQAGQRLRDKKAKLDHGEWLPWLEANADVLGFETPRTAQMLMKVARDYEGNAKSTSHFEPEEAVKISRLTWGNAPANYSSESNEWYTPGQYIDCVRDVLGAIDLDPASCARANETVEAERIFTADEDGLKQDWWGNVFVNPPYGTDDQGASVAGMFCQKAIGEYEVGRVAQCIILVNSLHSQRWQAPLYQFPVCLVDHRIQFVSGDGTSNKNPTFQNAFFYLGPDVARFAEVFTEIGYVLRRCMGR